MVHTPHYPVAACWFTCPTLIHVGDFNHNFNLFLFSAPSYPYQSCLQRMLFPGVLHMGRHPVAKRGHIMSLAQRVVGSNKPKPARVDQAVMAVKPVT